jgi:hypothetical protein
MSGARKPPSVGSGLVAALALSTCGAALLAALSPWLGQAAALRAVLALAGFAYVAFTIAQSGERIGRVTTIACWLGTAAAASLADLPLAAYVLVHLGLVWLARSLYYCSGLLPALADLGVVLLGAAFAAWAALRSGSAWLGLWCFFLVQALHVAVPKSLARRGTPTADDTGQAFARAHRAAERAVRRLSSHWAR